MQKYPVLSLLRVQPYLRPLRSPIQCSRALLLRLRARGGLRQQFAQRARLACPAAGLRGLDSPPLGGEGLVLVDAQLGRPKLEAHPQAGRLDLAGRACGLLGRRRRLALRADQLLLLDNMQEGVGAMHQCQVVNQQV